MQTAVILPRKCFLCKRKPQPWLPLTNFPPLGEAASLCSQCLERDEHKLVSKTEAKEKYQVSDRDLLELSFVARTNPHNRGTTVRLYLISQVQQVSERRAEERKRLAEREAEEAREAQQRREEADQREKESGRKRTADGEGGGGKGKKKRGSET